MHLGGGVKIGDHPGTIVEPLRTVAHHFPPKLPLFAILATFATFAVASRRFFPRRAYGLRTQLPQRPTRQPTCSFLVASMLQQHLSYIRPQRLYKPAFRPPFLDRGDSIRPSQLRTSTDSSRSQGLPQNLDITTSSKGLKESKKTCYGDCYLCKCWTKFTIVF